MSIPIHDNDVVVLAGARTPFGNFGGTLAALTATDLAVAAAEGALARSGVPKDAIDEIVFGNVMQTSADAIYLARHVGLRTGTPVGTPALTLNRLCGSGLQAVISAAATLTLGQARYALAGGSENMSQAPHVVRGARDGFKLGENVKFEDALWEALTDSYNNLPMAVTAENLAERYGVSRDECDAFALESQSNALASQASGYFADEIVGVNVPGPKGTTVLVDTDEGPRAGLSLEKLGKLPARFRKGGVVITPGNASGITDGAAALVLTTVKQARADGLSWIGRLVGSAVVGVDPDVMGIGPAFAIPKALERAGITADDLGVMEINEAFAPQVIACMREMKSKGVRLNPHGGAISLGHPLGASGARLALTTLHDLQQKGGGYGVASACIGGGQGIAAVFVAD